MIKIFSCGICDKDIGIRESLKKHLQEEHSIKKQKTNFSDKEGKLVNQSWWKWSELK